MVHVESNQGYVVVDVLNLLSEYGYDRFIYVRTSLKELHGRVECACGSWISHKN